MYQVVKGTRKETEMAFLRHLKRNVIRPEEVVVVMDNHRAHTSADTLELMEQLGLESINLPTYSSSLNPVEFAWNSLKKLWRAEMDRSVGAIADADVPAALSRVIGEQLQGRLGDIHKASMPRWRKVLEGIVAV